MMNNIGALSTQIKCATKLKLNMEKNLCQARNRERSLNEQVATVKSEIEFSKEQLEDIKNKLAQARHQISNIEICLASERSKTDAHVEKLQIHLKGFQQLFDKERALFDIRIKEIQEKEAEEEEVQRQKEKELAKKFEQEAKEAEAVEAECDALETECAILKKRNKAIMLQLRRKLLDAENARREIAKRNA